MPGGLEYDLGRADEPEEGQIHTKGQKNSSVKMGCKTDFRHLFCVNKRLRTLLLRQS